MESAMSTKKRENTNNQNQATPNKNGTIMQATQNKNEETPTENGQDIDKVRNLLFGGQMRDYEERFVAIEERFTKEGTRLRQDIEERMDSLETLVKREFESLTDKLNLEKKERSERLLSVETLLNKANDILKQRLNEAETKTLEEIRILRNQEHDDIKKVRQNIQELRNELSSQLETEIEVLRKTKVDRASVAALFAGGNM